MTSGDGGPSHRVIVTRGDDKSLNIGENVECKRHRFLQCRKNVFTYHAKSVLIAVQVEVDKTDRVIYAESARQRDKHSLFVV